VLQLQAESHVVWASSALIHVSMFVNGVSDMFMSPASSIRRLASASRLRFRNSSLHSSIHNFLLLCDSAVVFRESRLVRGMRVEVGEELKTGRAALGGARRVLQVGRLEKQPA